jgi:hypothetical protein
MTSFSTKLIEKISLEKILLILIVAIAFFFRVYKLPSELFIVETHNIFFGLRLHILDWFNLSDHVSQNFFKSLFLSTSLRYPLGTYASSTIYSWLNIPINQFWLLFFYVCFGTFCVAGTYVLGRQLADYRVGLIGATLLAVNSTHIHLWSRSEGANILLTFAMMICFITLIHYRNHRTWIWRTVLSFILPFIASDASLSLLPLVIIYQLIFFVPPANSFLNKFLGTCRYLVSKENILLWLPCFFTLLLHLYVYTRIGMSKVGLFGHIFLNHTVRREPLSLNEFFQSVARSFGEYSHYYFNPAVFYCSFAVFIILIISWKKNKLRQPLILSGVVFLYFFIVISVTDAIKIMYLNDTLNVLLFAMVWVSLFDFIYSRIESVKRAHVASFVLFTGLSLFLMVKVVGEHQIVIKRHRVAHPFKAMGYYIQEHGGDNPNVYLLSGCLGRIYHNAEFYFGTQIMGMGKQYNLPRKLFCMGTKSIEETLAAYKLDDFDFYVAIYNYTASSNFGKIIENPQVNLRTPEIESAVQHLITKGAKRVAVINNNGQLMGEIYSRRNLPFKSMDINEYDPLWDQKYANIQSIVKTVWTGQTTLWGYIWDTTTGIQRK